jgi:hypothetical protein
MPTHRRGQTRLRRARSLVRVRSRALLSWHPPFTRAQVAAAPPPEPPPPLSRARASATLAPAAQSRAYELVYIIYYHHRHHRHHRHRRRRAAMFAAVVIMAATTTGSTNAIATSFDYNVCSSKSWHNSTCLPRGVVVQRLPGLGSRACCSRCSEAPACVSWNVNHEQKLCFLRGDWRPVPGNECTAGITRPVPPAPPLPPAPAPLPPPPPPSPAPSGAKNVLFLVSDDMCVRYPFVCGAY